MKQLIIIGMAWFVVSCHSNGPTLTTANFTLNADTIFIPKNSNLSEKIKTSRVNAIPYRQKLTASGIVKAIPNNYAQIASPFAGRIIKSFIKLGDRVQVNAPIFEIISPSFFEAGKIYYKAKQEMQLAEKNLLRQRDLLKNGVGIQKDMEESEVNFDLSKRDYENSVASLKVYHVDPDALVLGQPLIVRSPISGEIISDNIVIGQYLREDAAPVALVAELGKVWVVGQLKEKDIHKIHESDEVEVAVAGIPGLNIHGFVYHISEMLDEETRSVEVFIECENKGRNLKPGMYVTAQFSEVSDSSILIPASAVLQMEESSFVFVKTPQNGYLKRLIETSGTDNDRIILKSGLKPDEEIVTVGGFYLLDAK
jgi:cobalt-zinc-cadmium efflux system membrane fusion protein